jgi:hypothetical protein
MSRLFAIRVHPDISNSAHATEIMHYLLQEAPASVERDPSCKELTEKLQAVGLFTLSLVDNEHSLVDVNDLPDTYNLYVAPYEGVLH